MSREQVRIHDSPASIAGGDYIDTLLVGGEGLTVDDVVRVARAGGAVALSDDESILRRVRASYAYIKQAVEAGKPIYGVTTAFGGMSNIPIPREATVELQNNLPWAHKTGAGKRLPDADVRAGMLLRANSLMHGASGIRLELIERIVAFLNAGATPHVYELGSIGASGDLVPLSYVAGALVGLDRAFKVDLHGEELDSLAVLERLGLPRLRFEPKEGLALINGTSMMAGIAAGCVYDARALLGLSMAVHALLIQGLGGTNQSFHPFIHRHKPHPGQRWAAARMLELLEGSRLSRAELDSRSNHRNHELIQDRYSLRCLPQYIGPIVDGLAQITAQTEIEMNSATDNPLIDADNDTDYHGGNFLGQYIGIGMDQLRYYIGLLAKHLDVQIALIVAPEFNNGLPPSLVGNGDRRVNLGLKGLQLTGNSIMPLLGFFGNSLVDRFPTHAEQFNQNINSQGFGSANLARQSIELMQQYMAVALLVGVQSVDLRSFAVAGHYDARALLSPATSRVYQALREIVGAAPGPERPLVWDDNQQPLDEYIAAIAADIAGGGRLLASLEP